MLACKVVGDMYCCKKCKVFTLILPTSQNTSPPNFRFRKIHLPDFCMTLLRRSAQGCQPVKWELWLSLDPVEVLSCAAEANRFEEGWQERTTHSHITSHSTSYTQSDTMFLSVFNWLPLPTPWQWKHWLSATINHSQFVWWDPCSCKSCVQK